MTPAKTPQPLSVLEETFALHVRVLGLPLPVREFVFEPSRKWRADFAWPGAKLLVELDGGTASGKGRHSRGKGFENDCEKLNAATMLGYHVLRYTMRGIKSGTAAEQVQAFLAARAQHADLFSGLAFDASSNTANLTSNDGAPAMASYTPRDPEPCRIPSKTPVSSASATASD